MRRLLSKLWTCLSAFLQEVLNSRAVWTRCPHTSSPFQLQLHTLVPPPKNPCEPFIPTPARYSGVLGSCGQFLHQCSLVFDQQPLMYLTDRSKIAFIMSLLSDKGSTCALAVSDSNSPPCRSFILFTAEISTLSTNLYRARRPVTGSFLYNKDPAQSPSTPQSSVFSWLILGGMRGLYSGYLSRV